MNILETYFGKDFGIDVLEKVGTHHVVEFRHKDPLCFNDKHSLCVRPKGVQSWIYMIEFDDASDIAEEYLQYIAKLLNSDEKYYINEKDDATFAKTMKGWEGYKLPVYEAKFDAEESVWMEV